MLARLVETVSKGDYDTQLWVYHTGNDGRNWFEIRQMFIPAGRIVRSCVLETGKTRDDLQSATRDGQAALKRWTNDHRLVTTTIVESRKTNSLVIELWLFSSEDLFWYEIRQVHDIGAPVRHATIQCGNCKPSEEQVLLEGRDALEMALSILGS